MLTTHPEQTQRRSSSPASTPTRTPTTPPCSIWPAGSSAATSSPATPAGYQELLDFVASHGVIDKIGVELTGSYGAGLTRHLTAAGVTVLEVNTTDKATRARRGKDDALDAVAAAQKVLSGMAVATPKDTTGATEAIRILTVRP